MTLYDRLTANPPEERHEVGLEAGEICGRYEQPDEDAPRGYKPKPCNGTMCQDDDEPAYCDTCGEMP